MILLVDDSRMNRMVLSKSLAKEGYELVEAENADVALKILDYRKPELILLDVVMPEMSGFDLCRLLKQQESTREIPIIFITTLDSTEDKIRGLELGAVDFITKPFNTAEILARVRTQVTLRQMYRTIIETNQRIAKDLETARQIQRNLLPAPKEQSAHNWHLNMSIFRVMNLAEIFLTSIKFMRIKSYFTFLMSQGMEWPHH